MAYRRLSPKRKIVCCEVDLSEADGMWSATLGFTSLGGRVECVSIDLHPSHPFRMKPLTTTVIRSVPLGRLIDRVREHPPAELRRWIEDEVGVRWEGVKKAGRKSRRSSIGRPV